LRSATGDRSIARIERESWTDAFCRLAPAHADRAAKAEAAGDSAIARKEYLIAHDCCQVPRYPALKRSWLNG
jgi:hypothetical protein